jgi:hypothetical protein
MPLTTLYLDGLLDQVYSDAVSCVRQFIDSSTRRCASVASASGSWLLPLMWMATLPRLPPTPRLGSPSGRDILDHICCRNLRRGIAANSAAADDRLTKLTLLVTPAKLCSWVHETFAGIVRLVSPSFKVQVRNAVCRSARTEDHASFNGVPNLVEVLPHVKIPAICSVIVRVG